MKTIKRLATLALAVFTSVGVWADVPFTPTTLTDSGEFAENTTWYTMTIGAGKLRISDNNGANKITVGGYLNAADENLWCFVGNETDGFMIFNKQAGATKALTAPTAITGSNDGTSYAILADIATLNASTHTNLWNFQAATATSNGSALTVQGAYYVSEKGYSNNILNIRGGALAFWYRGYDNGSAIIISPVSKTCTVDLNSGAFTAWNSGHTYASNWQSSTTSPTLTLNTGANNMSVNGTNINIAAGKNLTSTTGSCTATLSVEAEWVITGYRFKFKNAAANANALTITAGETTMNVTNEEQTISVSGLEKQSTAFVVEGDNHNVLLYDFTVQVSRAFVEPEPQQDLFITRSGAIPYRIPALAAAKNGNLIAISDYRPCRADIGYGEVDIVARISKDNGKTWGTQFTIGDGTGNAASRDCGFGDAAVVADRESNEVLLISVCGKMPCTQGTRENPNPVARFRSHDGGETWTAYEDITEDIYSIFDNRADAVRSIFFGSGRICQSRLVKVKDYYRLYAALWTRDNGNRVLYSDDFGETWNSLGYEEFPAPNGNEPKCEELPDGTVVLSSRTGGGRFFNFFTFTDINKAEGKWGTVAKSQASNNGTFGADCNGEIMIVPAVRNSDGKEVYVALQSVPMASSRQNVGIYYKELASLEDMADPNTFAANWDGNHQASYIGSAYSTMIMQANDSIAFLYEESTYGADYTNVYKSYSLEDITNGAYTFKKEINHTDYIKALLKEKIDAKKGLPTGNAVGMLDESKTQELEQALANVETVYENNPTVEGYLNACNLIEDAFQNAAIKLENQKVYTIQNKAHSDHFMTVASTRFTGTTDGTAETAKFVFFENEDGTWKIYNKEADTYVGKIGADYSAVPRASETEAEKYLVTSSAEGWSTLKSTTSTNTAHAWLHDNKLSPCYVVGWADTEEASKWKIVPTGEQLTAILNVADETKNESLKFYDLTGRQLLHAPTTGIYISSDRKKRLAR